MARALVPHVPPLGPAPPGHIVNPQRILAAQAVKEERWNIQKLCEKLGHDKRADLEWLAERRLLRNTLPCPSCNWPCNLVRNSQRGDGWQWHCRACRVTRSVRDGSFFSESHLSYRESILLTYCWAVSFPQYQALIETGLGSPETACHWYARCRDFCEEWLIQHPVRLGGVDANGQRKTVEIDESNFFKRKYRRGRQRNNHWVFGGIERESGECFLVEVLARDRVTLEAKIQEYILPGTRIIHDAWASYNHLHVIQGMGYEHDTIVHQYNFVDPLDPSVHTQSIEGLWSRVKRELRHKYGTNEEQFESHMRTWVYMNRHKVRGRGHNLFSSFISEIPDIHQF